MWLLVAGALVQAGTNRAAWGRKDMDAVTAYRYVAAWATAENEDIRSIQRLPSGDFFGEIASIGFQFDGERKLLVVRAAALPFAESLMGYPDILQELHRIAREEPERVDGAKFELIKAPWDKDEPTLYLRLEYGDDTVPAAVLIPKWRKLRETGYLWLRTRLVDAIDPIVQLRLKQNLGR